MEIYSSIGYFLWMQQVLFKKKKTKNLDLPIHKNNRICAKGDEEKMEILGAHPASFFNS